MKILLVAPTALDYRGKPIKQRRLHLPCLTLAMLGSVTPKEYKIKAVLETVQDIPFNEHWDLVGLTGMGSGIVRAWEIADQFREKGTKVVIGGIAASLGNPEWTLKHADSIVIGEAEETWGQVLSDAANDKLNKVYKMKRPPPIDQLPVPRYELMKRSKMGLWRPVQATRGCPFTCNFCSITSFFSGAYRKKSIEQVVRDVQAAKKHGTKYIAFIDDNISIDYDYCANLWEALIKEKIIWMSQSSLHISEHPELMKLAHRSGCRLLSFGIESTGEENLTQLDKEWNRPERYTRAFKALRENGIEISTEMIIGLDNDDNSVFERTFNFINSNKISVPRVHILTPVPGTPLYEKMLIEGRMLSNDFSRFSGGKVVFAPRLLNSEELQDGYWNLYEKLFGWKSILKRIVPNKASLGPYMRAVVWAVNLHYRKHVHHRICPGIV